MTVGHFISLNLTTKISYNKISKLSRLLIADEIHFAPVEQIAHSTGHIFRWADIQPVRSGSVDLKVFCLCRIHYQNNKRRRRIKYV
jgi:hypothetical protein